jgi:hypothetical protein
MKKLLVSVFLLAAFPVAAQQIRFSQRIYYYGTTVSVFNDVTNPVEVFVNGGRVGIVESKGLPWQHAFGRSVFPFVQDGVTTQIIVSARVCEAPTDSEVDLTEAPYLPKWATDKDLLGKLIMDDDFFKEVKEVTATAVTTKKQQSVGAVAHPSPREMRGEEVLVSRVNNIKKFLDDNKVVGRKALKKELDAWLKVVRRSGFKPRVPACTGPVTQGVTVPVQRSYTGGLAYALYVRGPDWNKGGGYWIEVR